MKNSHVLLLLVVVFGGIAACTGTQQSVRGDEIQESIIKSQHIQLERAQQTIALALEYHDQAGYEKGAELFLEAADLYRALGMENEERRTLIAAAKVQLKCSQRQQFQLTMARYKGLIGRLEMPPEEERLLVNLSDHMKSLPLTYPVQGSWQVIFKQ